MTSKEAVKNVIQTLITLVSLVIYSGSVKHNQVAEVYLQTTKSMPLPILQSKTTNADDGDLNDEY